MVFKASDHHCFIKHQSRIYGFISFYGRCHSQDGIAEGNEVERIRRQDQYVPRIHRKAFEDNMDAIELSRLPKLRPRTKYINVVYHHFHVLLIHIQHQPTFNMATHTLHKASDFDKTLSV